MIFTAENTLLIGSILLFVSIVVGKTGYRFGVPTLLLFLVVGMLFGSDGSRNSVGSGKRDVCGGLFIDTCLRLTAFSVAELWC